HVGGTLGHIAEELLAQFLGRSLERNGELRRVDFLEDELDSRVFHVHQVIEDEHLVDDALGKIAVQFAQIGDDGLFLDRTHVVQDLGRSTYTAHLAALGALAREHVVQHFGQFLQGRRLHAAKGGNAQHHVVAQALGQERQYVGGAVAFQVDQNRGDDLRMFVHDQFGNVLGVEPVQCIDAAGAFTAFQNVFNETGGAIRTKGFIEHGADVLVRTQRDRHELVGFLTEFFQHLVDVAAGDLLEGGHGGADLLDFAGGEELEDFGGTVFT